MEYWLKNFFKVMGIVMLEVESFFDEMVEEILEVFDEWGKFFEEIVEEISVSVIIEIDDYLNDLVILIIEVYLDFIFDIQEEEMDYYFIDYIEFILEEYLVCRGCIYYYG